MYIYLYNIYFPSFTSRAACTGRKIKPIILLFSLNTFSYWKFPSYPSAAQKMKFSITHFFNKCVQICSFL